MGSRQLETGDTVVIDIGATLDGYKSDITRVVHLGEPQAELWAAYEAVREAERARLGARLLQLAAQQETRESAIFLEMVQGMLTKMHDTLTDGDLQATQAQHITPCSRLCEKPRFLNEKGQVPHFVFKIGGFQGTRLGSG